ncbi:protein-export membrane protein SecF [candidate division WWE3 bacterium RIFOXYC1_FULL_40_10]|uniref:Protein-export membrane protein SecF n=1 Tax=candidate division WWE3 bacterium RIFOXYA2_FULL_46_9 TaxID=1802636 RepID=A0A1F4VYR4_UNCKA|nr:MAG: protein-export membrane protein SecF [candidate division WWE3 bacterium RIFOXYB1_FULL_40_22]OGC62203.1 MAG: protein-export membrane protein SecF [candidate division WWE3 bacterium RIFOXYA1_FULL_40_11]OGC62304.1 MAG: protein-export membrane protein SecF [candidate division WWE3 bacterium RIFOXYA2_FULL_46_9]OGC65106.1 MAG: protein-export membrane protein SecF [candidate division WWE3 bacterium RIFOXYB2_FULL_41_6]OGC66586.1 MAG: protein-export membrane protein SecF [candidate division WWE3
MMNLMKYKVWYLVVSLVLMLPGTVYLLKEGLHLAIDFTGGSIITFSFSPMENEETIVRDVFKEKGVDIESVRLDKQEKTTAEIKTKPLDTAKFDELKNGLSEKFAQNNFEQKSFETVGPVVGAETAKKAFVALAWAMIGIMSYIAYAFRNIPKPYSSIKFGISAIIAMFHDAYVVIGFFAILGHYFGVEIDALFITALLTVLGFSVHDTIVVFDRIRENLRKLPKSFNFEEVANFSVVETLARSLATSFTVVLTLSSLYVLGGASIKNFVLAMLVGIISGTYSSIFTATPILVLWEKAKR